MQLQDLDQLLQRYSAAIAETADADGLEQLRIAALGRKGEVTALMKSLGAMTPAQRQQFGPKLNGLKQAITKAVAERRAALDAALLEARLQQETVDITLPVRPQQQGFIHPVSQVIDEVAAIFGDMGFNVAEGPDIETDFHNFTALNMPPEHPARQMHDTFYFPADENGEAKLLRTHTSPVQVRSMQSKKPPLRLIVPGRTYRMDSDQTHTPMFHQVEGLVVDKTTHLGHLKGTLEAFCRAFFEIDNVEMRFRPSYFPFTEPSVEVDIRCDYSGDTLRIGQGNDWLEILGSGMVNPRVLEHCGIDPEVYQGFAFGMGIDRIAMLKYGIPDLRAFFDSDLRWLRHYGFAALDMPDLAGGLSR